MRRTEDGHAPRPAPFRVLAAPDTVYLSPPTVAPPPPRAPEPYKVAPRSGSLTRAHRRSSFVIIADSRPTSPEFRSPSPTLASGRVSPFRGRGFKGPPPRSKSRPQSPEPGDGRRRGRLDRRVSVSQQNSPRRSLIPQPTRQRSTSLTKAADHASSPRIGRRVDSRNRLNVSDSRNRLNASNNSSSVTNLATRRSATKTPNKLSPIQGTPTKPDRTNLQIGRRDRSKDGLRFSPSKTTRPGNSPGKNPSNHRRLAQDKGSSKDKLGSPSRIPLKSNRNSTNSLNPARFITIPNQSGDKGNKKTERAIKEVRNDEQQAGEEAQNREDVDGSSKEFRQIDKTGSSGEKVSEKAGELDLREMLKLSSGATGTSSVVNTTTTTAAQPLHIDANAVLADKNEIEKRGIADQVRNGPDTANSKSSTCPKTNGDSAAINQNLEEQRTTGQTSKSVKPGSSYSRSKAPTDSRSDSPVVGQSAKAHNRANGTSGTGSASQRQIKNQRESTLRNSKSIDSKAAEDSSLAQTVPLAHLSKSTENNNLPEQEKNVSLVSEEKAANAKAKFKTVSDAENNVMSTTSMTTASNDVNGAQAQATSAKANNVPVNNSVDAANESQPVNSANVRVRNDNRGSNSSLKSSAGISTDSIESVRSTDTGVSVNTVRGVSSPREKAGMHVVKRPQEIETLSGNVMHLEQNGEPALLAANPSEEPGTERFLTRWKKTLRRYCECCPSMRCLACRTDHKGLSWLKSNAKMTRTITGTKAEAEQQQVLPDTATNTAPSGCWSKLKNTCRCGRLRRMKCCARGGRVAPAEATVCCPPERRVGAICRRLFDRCKCKRAEAERKRSIRAKHSLTSVAPPPLSEEPKAKIPDVLVEHNSLMRGAIPCLPVPLAWFCLVWNVLLPGSGTVWSGIFNLCTGQPRFSQVAGLKSRVGAFVVNLVVGVGQLFTVLFCLVGWGWSIWWGVTLVRLARKYRRFKASEAASNDPEARGAEADDGTTAAPLPPGVPSQVLREIERTR